MHARKPRSSAGPRPSESLQRRTTARTILLGAAIAVAIFAVIGWFVFSGDRQDRPRLLDEAALAALPDAQLEQRLVNELAQRIAYAGYSDDGWRRFGEAARQVWAVAAIEEEVLGHGVGRLLADQARGDRGPALADARDAYTAMGAADAAAALAKVQEAVDAKASTDAPVAAYVLIARMPESRGKRIAYLRAHLAELANP